MLNRQKIQQKYQNSIAFRYLSLATIFLMVIQLVISGIQNKRGYQKNIRDLETKVETKADFLSVITRNAFLSNDTYTLTDLATQIDRDSDFVYTLFLNREAKIVASHFQEGAKRNSYSTIEDLVATVEADKSIKKLEKDILIGDRKIGELQLAYSVQNLRKEFKLLGIIDLVYAILVSILFATLTLFIFDSQILKPLQRITRLAKELATGNLERRIYLTRQDEIGELGDSLNSMAVQFQHTIDNLEQAMDEVLVAEKAKRNFLSKMSHELKTPLNGIIGFTQIMQQESDTSTDQLESLNIIEQNSLHLLDLINDVLDITQIESGRLNLNLSKFNLYDFLRYLEQMFVFKAQEKHLELLWEINDNIPAYIENDEEKLRQVLVNIIDNSIKYTKQGSIIISVKKQVNETQDLRNCLYFKIIDTGIGISQKNIENIFMTFADTDRKPTTTNGIGLGLPISNQIIQLMGGEISIQSEEHQGTIVRISIPLTEVDVTDLNFPQTNYFEEDILDEDSVESQFFHNPDYSYDLTKRKLVTMPSPWLLELQDSTIKIDNESIYAILDRIPNQDEDLKKALIDLIANFRYDSILELTDYALDKQRTS